MDCQKNAKDQVTAYLKDAVRAVQAENIETDEAIGSKETTNAVCCAVEAIFLHGLKGSNTNKNFWPLVKKFTHKATLSQVTELSQISSDVGRCRAWVRIAMNDGAIDSYCKVIMDDVSTVRQYYESFAFFRDVEQCNAILTHLQGLCNFVFNLAFNSTVLNQWTTTTLILSGMTTSGVLDWPSAFASSSSEHITGRSALEVSFQRRPFNSPTPTSPSQMSKSSTYPHDLAGDCEPCLELSQSEIDTILSMTSAIRDRSETPASVLSKPDFTENQPVIYNQQTCGISSDSDEHKPVDADQTDLRFEHIFQTNLDHTLLRCDPPNVVNSSTAGVLGKVLDSNREDVSVTLAKQSNGIVTGINSVSAEDGRPQLPSANVITETKTVVEIHNAFDEHVAVAFEENIPPPKEIKHEEDKIGINNSKDTGFSSVNGELSQLGDGLKPHLTRKRCVKERKHLHTAGASGSNCAAEVANAGSNEATKTTQSETLKTADAYVDNNCESESICDDIYVPRKREESFNSLLKTYVPPVSQAKIRTLTAIIDELPCMEESGETVQEDHSSNLDWASIDTTETYENSLDEKVNQQAQFLYQMSVEKGLRDQCYQCRNCARAIGMFYGQDRVCAYDGFHYCHECHENKEHWIPAKVVFNWDFRPYKVSNLSFDYLQKIFETPCLNIEKLNMKLYSHVKPLETILELRTQLRYIKSYMMTCTNDVALSFMQQFNGQPYLFEHIHLYSLKDLSLVPSGLLQGALQKILKFATSHVYNCVRCGLKGFYCEICQAAKVIYPFELGSTYRCPQCKAVYHNQCKTHLVPCPKCKRLSERENNLQKSRGNPIDLVNYSYQPESDTKRPSAQ